MSFEAHDIGWALGHNGAGNTFDLAYNGTPGSAALGAGTTALSCTVAGVLTSAAGFTATTGDLTLSAGQVIKTITPPSQITTADVVTFSMANMLKQIIFRDPAGANRADIFDTAANIVSGMPGTAAVGDTFEVVIVNDADADETITISAQTNLTLKGKLTIAQNEARRFLIRLTNVSSGSEAVTVIGLA